MTIKNQLFLVGERIVMHLISTRTHSISKFFVAESRIASVKDNVNGPGLKCILCDGKEQFFTKADMLSFDELKLLKIVEYPRELVASPIWYCASLYGGTITVNITFESFLPGDVVYYFELTREFFIKRGAKLIHTMSEQYKTTQFITGSFVFMGMSELVRFAEIARKDNILPEELEELKNTKTIVYKDGKYVASNARLALTT